jgi:AMMECR1 domain-containing protein
MGTNRAGPKTRSAPGASEFSPRRRRWIAAPGLLALLGACQALGAPSLVQRFTEDQTGAGTAALKLARQALDGYCLRRERPVVPDDLPALLHERGALFVSAQINGAPRCCMGSLYPRGASLAADIIELACRAAAHDLRFAPLRPEELPRLRVIVSILDPPVPAADPWTLDPLTDGLAVRGPRRTGVVLPGETVRRERFVGWAEVRADLRPGDTPRYFRLRAARFIEP